MAPQTNQTCPQTGNYMTDCNDKVVQAFTAGDTFPPCPSCSQNVNWTPTK